MIRLLKPDAALVSQFLSKEAGKPYSYSAVGQSFSDTPVPGFDNDFNTQDLGQGDAVWTAAKAAIRAWQMFPGGWAFVAPAGMPIQKDTTVAMAAQVMGIWWLNSCRIVYVVDEQDRFGFAYGTLPGHVECGEELFMVERNPEGRVRYVLKAFSKPRHWAARLAYPLARFFQRRFVRESKASMLAASGEAYAGL